MNMGMLPEDLLREILVRLPVKSLLRFCCVSKTWCDLINSPYFAHMHLSHAKNHRIVLMKRFIIDEKKALLSFHSDYVSPGRDVAAAAAPDLKLSSTYRSSIQLFGSCNGIVCIVELLRCLHSNSKDKFYLCNLATRQFLTLPPSPFGCPDEFEDISTTSLGFGFDPSTQDYKLVKFVSYRLKETMALPVPEVQIYNLRTNSWRKLEGVASGPSAIVPGQKFPASILQKFPVSILLNRSFILHWLAINNIYDDAWEGILSFDMCTEAFQKIELPSNYTYPGVSGYNLAVLNDCLAFILYKSRCFQEPSLLSTKHSIDIWVMMDYGIKESWVKKYSIHPFSLSGLAPIKLFTPWISWNSDILLFQSVKGHFLYCSLKDNNCQEICKYEVSEYGWLETSVYEETLVSFAGMGNGLCWKKM
ncbi:hypothetical protein ACH5RR_037947 [Cinchona calisaya]|uniref:F-box domain-containing protein n=1 Tax=Cinchona calisaya TaxID=153742 RepID=A0ABD2Y8Z3_9GENT